MAELAVLKIRKMTQADRLPRRTMFFIQTGTFWRENLRVDLKTNKPDSGAFF